MHGCCLQARMGVGTSAMATSKEWVPSTSASTPRKMSKAGYDITPLTQEQVDADAAKASPNTRCTFPYNGTCALLARPSARQCRPSL